jgi:hypothetical protein
MCGEPTLPKLKSAPATPLLAPNSLVKGSSSCALLLSQIPWFAGLLFRKRKEDDDDTTVYTYSCSGKRRYEQAQYQVMHLHYV